MPFKCFSCGVTFDSVEDFVEHRRSHHGQPEAEEKRRRGLTCLGCGAPIAVDPSKANFRGDISCPTCGQVMKVVLEDGQVVFALSKSS